MTFHTIKMFVWLRLCSNSKGYVLELNSNPQIFCHTVRDNSLDFGVIQACRRGRSCRDVRREGIVDPESLHHCEGTSGAALPHGMEQHAKRCGMPDQNCECVDANVWMVTQVLDP